MWKHMHTQISLLHHLPPPHHVPIIYVLPSYHSITVCDDHGVCLGLVYSNEVVSNQLHMLTWHVISSSQLYFDYLCILLHTKRFAGDIIRFYQRHHLLLFLLIRTLLLTTAWHLDDITLNSVIVLNFLCGRLRSFILFWSFLNFFHTTQLTVIVVSSLSSSMLLLLLSLFIVQTSFLLSLHLNFFLSIPFHQPCLCRAYALQYLKGEGSIGVGAGEGCGRKVTLQACTRYPSRCIMIFSSLHAFFFTALFFLFFISFYYFLSSTPFLFNSFFHSLPLNVCFSCP